jgi:stearoyl-CoA desaturase (delta-9 desaturase)
MSFAITMTVGYHRLFTHNAFICSKFWHYLFGFIGSANLSSSPVQWSSVHTEHHVLSDTKDDPYDSSFRYFFRFRERTKIKPTKNEARLLRDPMHKFFFNHSLSIVLCLTFILGIINWNLLLFGYLLPMTAFLVACGLHTIFAHGEKSVRNLWLMELIVPMAGEWLHKSHHERPRQNLYNDKPYYIDLGGLFIKLIRNDSK